jgi:hypothetical protein
MSHLRSLPLSVLLLSLFLPPLPARAEAPPQFTPTRDVDIVYDVTRPQQPKIRERVRWLAGEHLERIDGPDKSTTIFDRNANEITLLTPANRSYRKLDGVARRPLEPDPAASFKRGNESVVAGLRCTDWTWTEDVETHTICATPDGVLLRHLVDGQTVMQAHSVNYGRQAPELFEVPKDYAPALAPEGGPAAE